MHNVADVIEDMNKTSQVSFGSIIETVAKIFRDNIVGDSHE